MPTRRAALSEGAASNAPERLRRWWHWLGIAWLLVLLVMGAQQWRLWSQQSRIDTDILALLPQDAHDRLLSDVTRRIADGSSRQVVVLLGSKDGAAAKRAQAAFAAAMAKDENVPQSIRSRARQMAGLLGIDAVETPAEPVQG
ncbi:MAG: hypothetical protein DI592_07185 [Stenotrophomonas maltophilia]|nr:MAG: hypothetical protein DI592_07185 [Stenotrophomonas maltophilia]